MRSVLVDIDGSQAAESAVRCVAMNARAERIATIHLLNVQPPLGGYIGRFVSGVTIRSFQRDEGQRALAGARRLLEDAGIAHTLHIRVGLEADTIVAAAAEFGVDEIVLGADGLGLFGRLWFRSLAGRVVRAANRPVIIVKSPPPRTQPSAVPEKLRPAFSP
jgi:nucleotide-binding universal stress UspA family protein